MFSTFYTQGSFFPLKTVSTGVRGCVIITGTPAALLEMKCINFVHTVSYNRLKTSHQSTKGHMTFTRTWNQRIHVLYCVALPGLDNRKHVQVCL